MLVPRTLLRSHVQTPRSPPPLPARLPAHPRSILHPQHRPLIHPRARILPAHPILARRPPSKPRRRRDRDTRRAGSRPVSSTILAAAAAAKKPLFFDIALNYAQLPTEQCLYAKAGKAVVAKLTLPPPRAARQKPRRRRRKQRALPRPRRVEGCLRFWVAGGVENSHVVAVMAITSSAVQNLDTMYIRGREQETSDGSVKCRRFAHAVINFSFISTSAANDRIKRVP